MEEALGEAPKVLLMERFTGAYSGGRTILFAVAQQPAWDY